MGSPAIFKGKLVKFLAKAGILVPARGNVDRSATPAAGEMAFNTNANKLEVYNGTSWDQLGGGGVVGPIYSRSATGTATKIYGKVASDAQATRAVTSWTTTNLWPSLSAGSNNVCWSAELGLFVAVFNGISRVATSHDGISWTEREIPEGNIFNSICWSPALGLFVAVASSGANRVMTSPDGITWTARAASAANSWRSVCWSPELGLFVAVSSTGGTDRVMYSSNGTTWTAAVSTSDAFFSVCWSPELGIFCALASGVTITSPDGINWTSATNSINLPGTRASIVWSAELGIFCACTTGTSNSFATSTNGTTWTLRTAPNANPWGSLAWSPELGLFCATAQTGSGTRIATSPDGITWTVRTSPLDYPWTAVCWAPELGIFCSVSSTTLVNNGSMVSRDVGLYKERKVVPKYFYRAAQSSEALKVLRTFTRRTNAVTQGNSFSAACWSPELNLFVAFSDGANGNYLVTSPNGVDWTARTPSISGVLFTSVCWSAELNLFVAVASVSNVNAISTSPDGITWTTRSQTTATALQSVCWSPELSLFVAVGTNKIITSPDGITWTDRTSPASRAWRSVVWSPELRLFCAVASSTGFTSTIMTSSNGITWTTRTNIDTNGLNEVIWSSERGMFIATTFNSASNHFSISYNGVDWTAVSVNGLTAYSIDGAALWCAELGVFVATVYATVYISLDGLTWVPDSGLALNTGFTVGWAKKVWSPELNQFVFFATFGAVNTVAISRKGNLLSEILNLRTSRLY